MTRAESATVAFTGARLQLARYRAGLTMRELAARADLSHAMISQYETGKGIPTPAVLARLAIATGVPAPFFAAARRISVGGLDGTHFRSLRSTSKAARTTAWSWTETVLDVADALEEYVRLPEPDVPQVPVAPDADVEELENAAQHVREHWSLPDGPVGHLVRHLEAHGVLVARLPVADQGIDAYSHRQGDRPVVILGTDKADVARSRFDTAHELGHLVCHLEADPGSTQEQQAHAFAAELLMPRAAMLEVLPLRFSLSAYARLKQTWGVSLAALLYRARQLQVLSDASYRRAVISLNQSFGRRREPFPLPRHEYPSLLGKALTVAGVTAQDIAAAVALPVDDVVAVLGPAAFKPQVQP